MKKKRKDHLLLIVLLNLGQDLEIKNRLRAKKNKKTSPIRKLSEIQNLKTQPFY